MKNLLLLPSAEDSSYVGGLQRAIQSNFTNISVPQTRPRSASEVLIQARAKGATFVLTTDFNIIKMFDANLEGTASDNFGYIIRWVGIKGEQLRILFSPPAKWIWSVSYGEFLIRHFAGKLANGGVLLAPPVKWDKLVPENFDRVSMEFDTAAIISVDIETGREHLHITSVSYTAGWYDKTTQSGLRTQTFVLEVNKDTASWAITLMRQMNKLRPPKVMQNGKYDSTYFLRFGCPLHNYLWDTYVLFYCLFPELPKDIAFQSSFLLEDYRFWKDEGKRNLSEYNAKDTHYTLWTWMALVSYIQKTGSTYAWVNYYRQFPMSFPAMHAGLEGIKGNPETQARLHAEYTAKYEGSQRKLEHWLGVEGFNPGSPLQVKNAMLALGYKEAQGTDEKSLIAMKEKEELYELFVDEVLEYRGAKKAVSTYFEVTWLEGRLLYEIDPCGTDTGRSASKASNLWCGTQTQNIPPYAKEAYEADDGWVLFGVDKAQSESYCTGYLVPEQKLIDALLTSPDFHCHNCAMFFGIPFEELYDIVNMKPIRKDIRNVGKRVNHGANYNMGAFVLLQTMGTKAVLEAKRLLGLPEIMKPIAVCEYLLSRFDETYPNIRGKYHQDVIREIRTTGKLVLPNGWTRRTFLRPDKTKPELNSAVAHKPQSMSVHLVNEGWKKVWYRQVFGDWKGKLRVKAQIHDEVFGQVKIGHEYIVDEIADMMTIPTDIYGRTMIIPSTKAMGHRWIDCKD